MARVSGEIKLLFAREDESESVVDGRGRGRGGGGGVAAVVVIAGWLAVNPCPILARLLAIRQDCAQPC